jgi:7,8-dihydropterin-6-yl-methyl-4-(beta-D-ribofuranosyl)aminobenzene 5'-phosphate synthase
MSPDPPTPTPDPLDELVLTVVVDNETDTLSSVDAGVPQIPEVASLVGRVPPSRQHDGHDCIPVFDQLCVACHGLSVLATARKGGESRTVLFDVGPYADVWLENAERLALDLAAIETLFLSHWHFDHSGGIPEVVAAITAARRKAGCEEPLVVDLHPDRPDQRGIQLPMGTVVMLPEEPSIAAIESAGGRVVTHSDAHVFGSKLFLASGEIERVTAYETGLVGHLSFRGDNCEADPLILDERFVAAHVRGRGVTVLSACSHAGVVNACLAAKRHLPDLPIDVVLGGYHLAGRAMEPRIPETVRDLSLLIEPRIVAPGHCTGWRAKAALADAFAPGRYGPSVVGSRYALQGTGDRGEA